MKNKLISNITTENFDETLSQTTAIKFSVGNNEYLEIINNTSGFIIEYIKNGENISEARNITNFNDLIIAINDLKERYNFDLTTSEYFVDDDKNELMFNTSSSDVITIVKNENGFGLYVIYMDITLYDILEIPTNIKGEITFLIENDICNNFEQVISLIDKTCDDFNIDLD